MWKKYLVPPVVIYAVIFLFISALIGAKVDQTASWVWYMTLVITIIGLYWGTVSIAKPKSAAEGLKYGIAWVVVLVVLDFILTKPFVPHYFSEWKSYIPYALALLTPIIFTKKEK